MLSTRPEGLVWVYRAAALTGLLPWLAPGRTPGLPLWVLDLADQVQRRGQRLGAFVPLGRADLARVLGDVLGSLQLAQGFLHVTSDRVVVHFGGLDDAFRVDD